MKIFPLTGINQQFGSFAKDNPVSVHTAIGTGSQSDQS